MIRDGSRDAGYFPGIQIRESLNNLAWSIITWVILTIPLWEKPHCDEVFSNYDLWCNRTRFATDFVAICYKESPESVRTEKLRRDSCTSDSGGRSGRGMGTIGIDS